MKTFGKIQSTLLITLTVLFVSDLFKVAHSSELSHSRSARQLLIRCTANGLIPYPGGDTSRYIQCVWIASRGRWYYWVYKCPPGSGFDPAKSLCVIGITTAATTGGPGSSTGSMSSGAPTGSSSGGSTSAASMTSSGSTMPQSSSSVGGSTSSDAGSTASDASTVSTTTP